MPPTTPADSAGPGAIDPPTALRTALEAAWSAPTHQRLLDGARDRARRRAPGPEPVLALPGVTVHLGARGAEPVQLGFDSLWLLEQAWAVPPGTLAADLGTGTGVLAGALATRWGFVAATELAAGARRTAARTLAPRRTALVAADRGAALAPGRFELVVANPPYLPDPTGGARPYADGGPTGTEVPARFAAAALELLAPGGRALVLALDTRWDGGRRPLEAVVDRLRARAPVDVRTPPPDHPVSRLDEGRALHRVPGLEAASLVTLCLTREDSGPAGGDR